MTYDIIRKNLQKLEDAVKTFPDILGKYRESTDTIERNRCSSLASTLGLSDYINFIQWIEMCKNTKQEIISEVPINYLELREKVTKYAEDSVVKNFLARKLKKNFNEFLNSEKFTHYDNGHKETTHGRSRRTGRPLTRSKYFQNNFYKTKALICNWVIQNELETKVRCEYYDKEIKNFESEINTEVATTNDISNSIIEKINSIEYDFRKINFNLLKSEIERKIREKILSVDKDVKLKCIESGHNGITLDNLYVVNSYELSHSGSLVVYIINDDNKNVKYNYRLFENISRLRDKNIDDILSFLED